MAERILRMTTKDLYQMLSELIGVIDAFEDQCAENDHTDSGETWEVLHSIKNRLEHERRELTRDGWSDDEYAVVPMKAWKELYTMVRGMSLMSDNVGFRMFVGGLGSHGNVQTGEIRKLVLKGDEHPTTMLHFTGVFHGL